MNSNFKVMLCGFALSVAMPSGAAELGRLFFTPDQRAQLDFNFAQGDGSGNNSHVLILNGIVQKHGGKRTAWINGVPQSVRNDERSPESVPVPLPGQNKSVKLKVGQHVLLKPSANADSTKQETSPDMTK